MHGPALRALKGEGKGTADGQMWRFYLLGPRESFCIALCHRCDRNNGRIGALQGGGHRLGTRRFRGWLLAFLSPLEGERVFSIRAEEEDARDCHKVEASDRFLLPRETNKYEPNKYGV